MLKVIRVTADGRIGAPKVLDRQPVPAAEEPKQPRTPRFWGADLTLAGNGTVTAAWVTTPATAEPGQRARTMTIAMIAPDDRIESGNVTEADGNDIDRARVDQLSGDVVLVSWWRIGRDGRMDGVYDVEVSR